MTIKFESGTSATLQNSSSSALSNNSQVACATTYDNGATGNLFFYGNLRLATGFTAAPTIGNVVELYLTYALDGTNYPDVDTSSTPPTIAPDAWVGNFIVSKSQTGSQTIDLTNIPLKPYPLKAYLVNRTGQQMSAGFTVNIYPTREQ